MADLTNWWDTLTDEIEDTIEYKVESVSFNIAVQVYERMRELGLTQKELANKLNVSKSYISQILKGKSNMTIETMVKLSNVLDLTPSIKLAPKETASVLEMRTEPTEEGPIYRDVDGPSSAAATVASYIELNPCRWERFVGDERYYSTGIAQVG